MFSFYQKSNTGLHNNLAKLPLNGLVPNPSQPRRSFYQQSLEELASSIAQYGLMQPIVVRQNGEKYEIIAGERRFRACKLLNFTHVDCIVIEADCEQSACMALIENLQRENLHFFEEAESYVSLMNLYGLTQEQLAAKVGKNQASIANKLRILRLPYEIREALQASGLSERHARALIRLKDEKKQYEAFRTILAKGLNVNQTDKYIDSILMAQETQKQTPQRAKITHIYKDYRLFVNTITNAVKDLSVAGVEANYEIKEQDDQIAIVVCIPKIEQKVG